MKSTFVLCSHEQRTKWLADYCGYFSRNPKMAVKFTTLQGVTRTQENFRNVGIETTIRIRAESKRV